MTAIEFWQLISGDSTRNMYKALEIDSHGDSSMDYPTSIKYVFSNIPSNEPILRKQAAKIVHVYMKEVLGIPDETDPEKISTAMQLKDIYDCRNCVEDIIQVFVSGIMEACYDIPEVGVKAFGGAEELDEEEAYIICEKLKNYKQEFKIM